jgi:hypothetical protein
MSGKADITLCGDKVTSITDDVRLSTVTELFGKLPRSVGGGTDLLPELFGISEHIKPK